MPAAPPLKVYCSNPARNALLELDNKEPGLTKKLDIKVAKAGDQLDLGGGTNSFPLCLNLIYPSLPRFRISGATGLFLLSKTGVHSEAIRFRIQSGLIDVRNGGLEGLKVFALWINRKPRSNNRFLLS